MYMIKIIPKQRKQKKNTLIGTENKLTVVRGDGRGGWVKKVKGSKRYDPLVIKKSHNNNSQGCSMQQRSPASLGPEAGASMSIRCLMI